MNEFSGRTRLVGTHGCSTGCIQPVVATPLIMEDAKRQSGPNTVKYLGDEIEAATARRRVWMSFGICMFSFIEDIWHLLSPAERMALSKEYDRDWKNRRTGFPLQNARKLRELLLGGSVTVGDGLDGIDFDKSRNIYLATESGVTTSPLEFDVVVNATGFSTDVAKARDPLLRSLLDSRIAAPDPFGGITVNAILDWSRIQRVTTSRSQ